MIDLTQNNGAGSERVIYGLMSGSGDYDFYPTRKEAEWHNRMGDNEGVVERFYFNLTREGVCKLLNHLCGSNSDYARKEAEKYG